MKRKQSRQFWTNFPMHFLVSALILAAYSMPASTQTGSRPAQATVQLVALTESNGASAGQDTARSSALPQRDGSHDFDFLIGDWKAHVRVLRNRLATRITGKNGHFAEVDAHGTTGHLELMALRLYDPQAHQWSINASSSKVGTLNSPLFGEFKNGRGEFFDTEPFNGHSVLVPNAWTDITADSWRFEQPFCADGGKTWEANWVEKATR
jgi:hypothetical protein